MKTLNECLSEMESAIRQVEDCIAEARAIMAEMGDLSSGSYPDTEPLDINLEDVVEMGAPAFVEEEMAEEPVSETESLQEPDVETETVSEQEPEVEAEAEAEAEPEQEIEEEVEEEAEAESEPEAEAEVELEAETDPEQEPEIEPVPEPESESETEMSLNFMQDPIQDLLQEDEDSRPLIMDRPARAQKAAVLDMAGKKNSWRTDIPGVPVKNILSAISLNDRVLFINSLFRRDALLFQSTVSRINNMTDFDEAEQYLTSMFPEWKLDSEAVYRFMMAIRRRFS